MQTRTQIQKPKETAKKKKKKLTRASLGALTPILGSDRSESRPSLLETLGGKNFNVLPILNPSLFNLRPPRSLPCLNTAVIELCNTIDDIA